MTNQLVDKLCIFLKQSPTAFHATSRLLAIAEDAGYEVLDLKESWQLEPGKKYCVALNQASFIGFHYQPATLASHGMRIVGAHTDSPHLKLKPKPDIQQHGYKQLNVEPYGGVLLNPWFDRDLAIAGRVTYSIKNKAHSTLIDIKKPIACIPSLAIHLDKNANNERTINKDKHILPIVGLETEQTLIHYLQQLLQEKDAEILSYELSLYDHNPPAIIGWQDEFITSARLDNLLSCFCGISALLEASSDITTMLLCTDHEEVGSCSATGADSQSVKDVISRICQSDLALRSQVLAKSVLVSTDNAHAIHPNYAEKHDQTHRPLLNGGVVIKYNANQRYATDDQSAALIKNLAKLHNIPLQDFTCLNSIGCGSTIGPIIASHLGIKTIDIGIPTLAMHSIREIAGVKDISCLIELLKQFYSSEELASCC